VARSGSRIGLLQPRWRSLAFIVLFGQPAALAALGAQIFTDALWFHEVGQIGTYQRMLVVKVLVAASVAIASALVLLINIRIAVARSPSPVPPPARFATSVASLFAGGMLGAIAIRGWQRPLLWFHGGRFGVTDAVHHRDIGFFIFSLPFYEWLVTLLLGLVATAMVLTLVVDLLTGAAAWRPFHFPLAARLHLASLVSFAVLIVAWRIRLEEFAVGLRQHPESFPGVHYVDFYVRLPGLQLLFVLALACAGGLVAATYLASRRGFRVARNVVILPVAAFGLVALISQSWAPSLVQRFTVDPHPFEKERVFLREAILSSRRALGLDKIDVHPFVPRAITAAQLDIDGDSDRLERVQLWETRVLHLQMQQLDSEMPYYRALEPTVDAYQDGDDRRLVVVAERQLNFGRVSPVGRGWDNQRLAYTHGLGVFRVSATQVDDVGRPVSEDAALPVREPRIYFGRLGPGAPTWVLVNTRRPEVDVPQPTDQRDERYHYRGSGGIALSSLLRRAAFALVLRDWVFLISDELTPRSRLMLRRDVLERLQTLAPFVLWDPNPATVIADGRIVFLVEGYTVSDMYPGAEAVEIAESRVTYARATVRATVDAFSGRTELYVADPAEPIIRAWSAVFPSLFRPISRMADGLREHLRYPSALFDAQAQLYERYHTTSPDAFSTQADAWAPPTSLAGRISIAGDIRFDETEVEAAEVDVATPPGDRPDSPPGGDPGALSAADFRRRPSYSLSSPPGEHDPRLLRTALYSPYGGENFVATLHGWVDDQGNLRLASRSLPRDRVILGTAQMSRLALTSPRVRQALRMLNEEVRDLDQTSLAFVTLGTGRVVFFSGGILQIQATYVEAGGQGVPRLLGIIVFIDGCVGIGRRLDDALRDALACSPL
jgi:uncharacterized protein